MKIGYQKASFFSILIVIFSQNSFIFLLKSLTFPVSANRKKGADGKCQKPYNWDSDIEKKIPWCWDSGSLGQSQRPSFWDSPKVLGPSHAFGSLKLRNNPHGVGTLGLWDSPNLPGLHLGLSQSPGTVPGFWVSEIEK